MDISVTRININISFYPGKTAAVLCHAAFSCNGQDD
jgi:hypothetical protein